MHKADGPLSGRRREAARNDIEILAAAREVFLAAPAAPISAVADRAKVGISALYRRYASKDDLLRELARDGIVPLHRRARSRPGRRPRSVDGLHRLPDQNPRRRKPGPGPAPGLQLHRTPTCAELAQPAGTLAAAVHERAQRDGARRTPTSTRRTSCSCPDPQRRNWAPNANVGQALRRRYLTLFLQALHAPGTAPLPGPAADPAELAALWTGTSTRA